MRKIFDLLFQQAKKTYGMWRDNQSQHTVASEFSFGVKWSEVDRIVVDLYKVKNQAQQILFCTPSTGPYIGFSSASATTFNFSGLTDGTNNLTPSDIVDEARHVLDLSFSSTSDTEIKNVWDRSWAKQIGYISIQFWKDGTMIRNFVPNVAAKYTVASGEIFTDEMIDTVTGTVITASVEMRHQLEVIS